MSISMITDSKLISKNPLYFSTQAINMKIEIQVPFTKILKYIGAYLKKYVQNLYTENYKYY